MATAGRLIECNSLKKETTKVIDAGVAIGVSGGRRESWNDSMASLPAALRRPSHVTRAAFGVSILTLSPGHLKLFLKSITLVLCAW